MFKTDKSKVNDVSADAIVELNNRIDQLIARVAQLEAAGLGREGVQQLIQHSMLVPALDVPAFPADAPFMAFTTCAAADFQHPRYFQLCKFMDGRPQWHRKQWEWVFILHHLFDSGALKEGARGLGFGVGREPLPAAFALAGATVVATDAPTDLSISSGWMSSSQHSASLEELRFHWIPDEIFKQRISFQSADMTNIDPQLSDFDFVWSSCCFEHLGSLRAGLDFVRNSVETCLKPGGIAVHTTEFNLSSNDETVEESDDTVIYRRCDLEEFAEEMRERGHEVYPIIVGPQAHGLDFHVDIPPFLPDVAHLRLRLGGYSCTSAGIVIRRGG
ncbi:MAG: class I SAM-dependent methyltransferase [Sphingobium sp.]